MAATALSGMAQYSSNIVGYATISLPPGYSILANPLNVGATNGANEIGLEIPGEIILTWNDSLSSFNYVQYDPTLGLGNGWLDVNLNPSVPPSLRPGVGFFFFNPLTSPTNFTFVGQVVPGPSSTNHLYVVPGYSMMGSRLPASVSDITKEPVGLPLIDGMQVLTWDNAKSEYSFAQYDPSLGIGNGWFDANLRAIAPPPYSIGQGFFFFNPLGGIVLFWVQSLP